MTLSTIIRSIVTAGLVSATFSTLTLSPAVAQRLDIQAGPHCQLVRMQVPAGAGFGWKQTIECPNSD